MSERTRRQFIRSAGSAAVGVVLVPNAVAGGALAAGRQGAAAQAATPSTYYVIFSGRCNLSCTFCTIFGRFSRW